MIQQNNKALLFIVQKRDKMLRLRQGGQVWMLCRQNESKFAYYWLALTSIFGLCFMPVCLIKSNCYSLIYSSLVQIIIENYETLPKYMILLQGFGPTFILVNQTNHSVFEMVAVRQSLECTFYWSVTILPKVSLVHIVTELISGNDRIFFFSYLFTQDQKIFYKIYSVWFPLQDGHSTTCDFDSISTDVNFIPCLSIFSPTGCLRNKRPLMSLAPI